MLGKRSEQDSVKEAYDMRGSKPVQALWFVCGCSQQPDGKVPLLKEIIETPPNPQRFHLRENDPRYFWRFWRNIWPARTWTVSCVNWMPSRLPGICMLSSLQHYFFVTALSLSLNISQPSLLLRFELPRRTQGQPGVWSRLGGAKASSMARLDKNLSLHFMENFGNAETWECSECCMLPFVAFPLSRYFFRSVGAKALADHCDDQLKINEKKA